MKYQTMYNNTGPAVLTCESPETSLTQHNVPEPHRQMQLALLPALHQEGKVCKVLKMCDPTTSPGTPVKRQENFYANLQLFLFCISTLPEFKNTFSDSQFPNTVK